MSSFAGDGVFHLIGLVNENLANLQTGFWKVEVPYAPSPPPPILLVVWPSREHTSTLV